MNTVYWAQYPPKRMEKEEIRILVIDDEQEVCYLLCNYLAKKGFQTDYSTSLKDATQKIRQEEHDVIIVDINLQEENGLSLLKDKVIPNNVKTIVMSAMRDKNKEALDLGADRFIAKPFSINDVVDTIDDLRSKSA